FDYLDHDSPDIANDAYGQFITSTDPDIRTAARKLSAARLRRLIEVAERETPHRLRLYGYLLGNCGKAKDSVLLRKVIDGQVRESETQIDGILTGYTLLDPKGGWAFTKGLLEPSSKPFMVRYSALRAVRYFYTTHPGIVSEKELLGAVKLALAQND